MTSPSPIGTGNQPTESNPFDALDSDWATLCTQHRRSTVVTRWTRREPALAAVRRLDDVIPPRGTDWTATSEAMARLAKGGDDLAARALLQLLLPGLVSIAKSQAAEFGSTWRAGHEALALAATHIGRLRTADIQCSVVWHVLRSVRRDLGQLQRGASARRSTLGLTDLTTRGATRWRDAAPSAEDAAMSGPILKAVIVEAARRGQLSDSAADVVWLRAEGHSLTDAARHAGVSVSQAHRMQARALTVLRGELDGAS